MTTIRTRRPLPLVERIRIAYLRWQLHNAESDVEHSKQQTRAHEQHVASLRVELARMGGL